MYMDVRIPLPINSNPGMVLPPRQFTTVNDVARFAAQVIDGIMRHKETIDRWVVDTLCVRWSVCSEQSNWSFADDVLVFKKKEDFC